MRFARSRLIRGAVLLIAATTLASCGLPRTGPTKQEVLSSSIEAKGDAYIVMVDDRVTRATATTASLGFSRAFRDLRPLGSDLIRPGDRLSLTVWENVDDGLLARGGLGSTTLQNIQVDGDGYIFVPYAGRIRASGKTPEEIRQTITARLSEQTPDPQVEVRRVAGDGATVTVIGTAGGQGVFPIERPTRTLAAMLARAGGVAVRPEIAKITVVRGKRRESIWFQDLFEHPELDIALRDGDKILIEADPRAYTVLGASGSQGRVPFDTQSLSLIEAVARVGGLSSSSSDPTGVFVLREEPAEIARAVLGRNDIVTPQRMIYVVDLTRPNGLFFARDFAIRDGDTIYVTEAPFTRFSRIVSATTGSLGAVASVDSAAAAIAGSE